MTYSISCVLLIPDAHRDDMNALAEEQGYGPDNLSVPLVKSDGTKWWGCHTWCVPSFSDGLLARPTGPDETLNALIVSAVPDGNPTTHWAETLEEYRLSVISDE
ncbi:MULTISPECIES: hypothetical protein [Pseudomonas]|uniref:hypothetical protein n=1 Tax=Pseudomonas TaxID=286 RepID=UPI00273581C1|nr:hypothetical protein [Pseudomonas sp. FP833]WLI49241.1 hypothetical protein PSH63_22650 [Pseudomonas sp. FP833]